MNEIIRRVDTFQSTIEACSIKDISRNDLGGGCDV
jgi:hypothetical protein